MYWSLDHNGIEDVRLALRVAWETVEGYGLELELIAARLRDGETVPPFVDGEGGAIAAERMAHSHLVTGRRLRALAEDLEDAEVELAERCGVYS